ncbi:hypothetical protein FOXYSP1_17837 [Fusarium oxysporum f. sp. phaseoli]
MLPYFVVQHIDTALNISMAITAVMLSIFRYT